MSPSSVCQGLQSCLEPRVIEPRVLRLKLAPPGSKFSPPSGTSRSNKASSSPSEQEKPLTNHECDKKDTKTNIEGGGWSFLQALSHCGKTEDDQVYVHPTVKRSSSMLNEKSLEMCTESLGSETGSNAGESSDQVSLFSFYTNNTNTLGVNTNCVSKRVNRACNFPPPLTSITDLGGVHFRPHREGGRLILEAIASPSPRPYFHAERGDGRLRLCIYESLCASDGDDDEEVADGEEGVGEEWSNDEDERESEKEQEACGEEDIGVEEELEEYVDNVEDEMGVQKFARPSRCKESGNRDIFGDGYFELPPLSLCL